MKSNFSLQKTIAIQLIDNYAKENTLSRMKAAVELDRKRNALATTQFCNNWKKKLKCENSNETE